MSEEQSEFRRMPTEAQYRDAAWTGFSFLTVDAEGIIVHITDRAEQLFGYMARNHLVGHSVEELIPELMRTKHVSLRKQFLSQPSMRQMNQGRAVNALRNNSEIFRVCVSLRSFFFEQRQYVTAMISEVSNVSSGDSGSVPVGLVARPASQ